MNVHVGFTGTRRGPSLDQSAWLSVYLGELDDGTWIHHGDCIGVDAAVHVIARRNRLPVRIHPPIEQQWRAFCGTPYREEAKPYLERNREIVKACGRIIALPSGRIPKQRSGTWMTMRWAVRQAVPLLVVWPDGRTTRGSQTLFNTPSAT